MNYPNKINYCTLFSWLLVLLWMMVIFALSAQPAKQSSHLSSDITQGVIKGAQISGIVGAEKNISKQKLILKTLNGKVREIAHASVYLVLALLVTNAIKRFGFRGFRLIAYSFLFCSVYAWSDEIHQIFVPGRAAEFLDISLDFTGALLGIGLFYLGLWIWKLFRVRRKTV